MIVDYDFYVQNYGGKVDDVEFKALNVKAEAIVNYYTFGRLSDDTDSEPVKYAICEVIDVFSEEAAEKAADKQIISETIGSHSVKYAEKKSGGETAPQKIFNICSTYLMNTGLMYRGNL